jgi:hypothetical protein
MVDICHMGIVVRTKVKPVFLIILKSLSGLRAYGPYGVVLCDTPIGQKVGIDMEENVVAAQIALNEFAKTGCEKVMFSMMGMENGCKCVECNPNE